MKSLNLSNEHVTYVPQEIDINATQGIMSQARELPGYFSNNRAKVALAQVVPRLDGLMDPADQGVDVENRKAGYRPDVR